MANPNKSPCLVLDGHHWNLTIRHHQTISQAVRVCRLCARKEAQSAPRHEGKPFPADEGWVSQPIAPETLAALRTWYDQAIDHETDQAISDPENNAYIHFGEFRLQIEALWAFLYYSIKLTFDEFVRSRSEWEPLPRFIYRDI